MYTIVGSQAALFHGVIPKRIPKDWDIFADENGVDEFLYSKNITHCTYKDTPKGLVIFSEREDKSIIEVELAEKCDNTRDILYRMNETATNNYASTPWLYFLKMSHRYKKDSPHFLKTLVDAQYMHSKGIRMPPGSEELFREREKLTYRNKLPNLNQKADTFFKKEDGFYKYEHDDLHVSVAILDRPAYTYYLKDGSEVLTDRSKFFSLPENIRLLGGLEESLVLCAERSLIPNNFTPDPDKMFRFALSKVCTSITGGYFREFCWWNYFKICKMYDHLCKDKWVDKLRKDINDGKIRKFKGNLYAEEN